MTTLYWVLATWLAGSWPVAIAVGALLGRRSDALAMVPERPLVRAAV